MGRIITKGCRFWELEFMQTQASSNSRDRQTLRILDIQIRKKNVNGKGIENSLNTIERKIQKNDGHNFEKD
jgi:hypothetical protein